MANYIDIHVHILPGMDDGPSTIEESLEMARIAVENGTRIMISTPHCLNGVYVNWRKDILSACMELNSAIEKHNIPLTLLPGAEIHLSPEIINALEKDQLMTLNDTGRYIFLELPDQFVPQATISFINRLKNRNITPIITHPERNPAIQHNVELLYDLISAGALSQITAGSLTGGFGQHALRCSQRIIKLQMAHFMASDAHSPRARPPDLHAAFENLSSLTGETMAKKIMFEAPQAVLKGKEIQTHFS